MLGEGDMPFEGRDRVANLMRSFDELFLRSFTNFEEFYRSWMSSRTNPL